MSASSSKWKHRWAILKRIAAKKFYRFLGKKNLSLQPQVFFSIKPGYHHAANAEQFDARGSTDEWQKEVYLLAAEKMKEIGGSTVIDVGCGSGYKLLHMLGDYKTLGIEVNPGFDWLKEKYPEREWLLFDEAEASRLKADLVICADVIEHLENPDDLLDFMDDIDFRLLLISTPERDAQAGKNDFGPPENTSHYREWNAVEFKNYLRQWFVVKDQVIFTTKSITQVVICEKKKPS